MKGVDPVMYLLTNNLGTKIVSVVIAVVLWVVVLGSRTVEVIKEIPLEIATGPDLIVANEVPEKIAFRLGGPKAFLRAILDRPEDPIRVNLTGAKAGLVTYRFFADNIRLPIGVRVLQVNPTSISVKLEPQRAKEVPVRLELKGQPPEGYQLVKADIVPKTVKIRGPESRVDAITEIPTRSIDLSQMTANTEFPASFEPARIGVKVDGASPQVKLEVNAVQANFKIRNVEVRVEADHKYRLDENTVTVYVRVDPSMVQTLDRGLVFAEINLKGKTKGRYTEKVKVNLPPKVGLVRIVPDTLKVTLY